MGARLNRPAARMVAIALAVFITLSGCVSMELESEFDEEGGAIHSMAFTIDTSQLGELGGLGEGIDPFEDFEDIEEEAAEEGFRVERIEDGDIVGVRIIQEVSDSSELGGLLNGMFNAGAGSGEAVSPFTGTFDKDGSDYTLNLTVDGSALTSTAGEDLGNAEGLGLSLDTIFDFTYTARLPGEIDEENTNGRVTSDGAVTWDLPLEGTAALTAASSTGSDTSNLILILIVIGIIILGLIALAAVAFFVLLGRRSTPAPAVAPTAPPSPEGTVYGANQPTQPSMPVVIEDEEQTSDDETQSRQ